MRDCDSSLPFRITRSHETTQLMHRQSRTSISLQVSFHHTTPTLCASGAAFRGGDCSLLISRGENQARGISNKPCPVIAIHFHSTTHQSDLPNPSLDRLRFTVDSLFSRQRRLEIALATESDSCEIGRRSSHLGATRGCDLKIVGFDLAHYSIPHILREYWLQPIYTGGEGTSIQLSPRAKQLWTTLHAMLCMWIAQPKKTSWSREMMRH